MKTLLALLLLTLPCLAAEPQPAIAKAIAGIEKQWSDAMLHRDAAALERLLADDLSYTHSSAKHETKADVLQVIKSNSLTYKEITFRDVKVRQYGNTVVVTHDATIVTEQTGSANLFVTHVWVKQNGGWQLVHRQATKNP